MEHHLVILEPQGSRDAVALTGDRLTLGRSSENDVRRPDDTSLSRHHLVLERERDRWVVRDLGSKNGTRVNGIRISGPYPLSPGDRISAGRLVLAYDDPEATSPTPVSFVSGAAAEPPGSSTIMTSLKGVLAEEETGPPVPGVQTPVPPEEIPFSHPAFRALLKAGRELAGRRPLHELFQRILDLAIETASAERGVLLTLEDERLVVQAGRGGSFEISTTVRDRVLRERASLLVKDVASDESFQLRQSLVRHNIGSMIAVPLQTNDRVIGLVYVDRSMATPELTRQHLNLLTVLANVAAVRIETERLARVEELEKLLARDLQSAAEIQRRLLPSGLPGMPGVAIAAFSTPCRTVGGDYYGVFRCREGSLSVAVGDVSGKGMPAALLMSSLHAMVRVLVDECSRADVLASKLNRAMAADCPSNRFVTFFVCRMDAASGELTYCNAGHDPPILVRSGGTVQRLEGGGPVLAVFPDAEYRTQSVRLEPGDTVALYSDGVVEAASPGGEEFGTERLAEIVAAGAGSPPAEIVQAVTKELDRWTAGEPPADDVTLVVMRKTRAGGSLSGR